MHFPLFPLTTDQKVWGSNPYGCTQYQTNNHILNTFTKSLNLKGIKSENIK